VRGREIFGWGLCNFFRGCIQRETIVMGKNLQLRINEPCHESWEKMEPGGAGRFCRACEKVVVDFSVMSDREVLEYLSRARGGVCGFLSEAKGMNEVPEESKGTTEKEQGTQLRRRSRGTTLRRSSGDDQLRRDFRLGEDGKKKLWRGWAVLVVGLLFGSSGVAQQRAQKAEVHQVPVDIKGKIGEPAAKADSFKVLPAVTVVGRALEGRLGGIVSCVKVTNADVLKKKVLDTLALLGLEVRRELVVYPNPARRGSVVSLSWKVKAGEYQVGLFNAAGALVQQRVLEVHDGSQVDLFEIPAGLSGGVYFLRAVKSGGGKEITGKIVVI
jgi:hypothetical protein